MPVRVDPSRPGPGGSEGSHKLPDARPSAQPWWCFPARGLAHLRAHHAPFDRYVLEPPAWGTVTALAGTAYATATLAAQVSQLCLPATANLPLKLWQRLPTLAYVVLNLAACGDTLRLAGADWAAPCLAGASLGLLAGLPLSEPEAQAAIMAAGVVGTAAWALRRQRRGGAGQQVRTSLRPEDVEPEDRAAVHEVLAQVRLGHLQASAAGLARCLLRPLDPASQRALMLEQAHAHILYGRYDEGLACLAAQQEQLGADPSWLALRALCLARLHEPVEAGAFLRQALIVDPTDFWVCYARGLLTGRSVFFREALRQDPEHRLAAVLATYHEPWNSHLPTVVQRRLRDFDELLAPLALEGFALFWRGCRYESAAHLRVPDEVKLRWRQQAQTLFSAAVRQHPTYTLPLSIHARMLTQEGDSEEAQQALDQARACCPNDPNLMWTRAFWQCTRGDGKAALQLRDRAHAHQIDPRLYFFVEAFAYLDLDDFCAVQASTMSLQRLGYLPGAEQLRTYMRNRARELGTTLASDEPLAEQTVACL